MGANEHHIWNFRDATAELGIQPASCPAGAFPLLCGIDGRYGDVLRRYPGHKRYPDSTAALGCTATANVFNPNFVAPFEIQKSSGSLEKIRGFVVYDEHTGACEFWYKFSTDASGVLRKGTFNTSGGLLFRTLADPSLSPVPQPAASGVGELPAIFNGATYTAQEINCMVVHSDGSGTNLYAAGIFRFAGDRHCQCICRWDGTRWTPLPDAFFNGGAVLCMLSMPTGLFVGGAFTSKGSIAGGQDATFKYICQWDGARWGTLGGNCDGAVRAMVVSGTDIIVGGSFLNVEDSVADVTPDQASQWLAKWQTASNTWGVSTRVFTGGTGVFAIAVSGSTLYIGGDWDIVDAVADTDHIATLSTSFGVSSPLGTGIPDGVVYTIKAVSTSFFVGGSFDSAGGIANTKRIARWSGAAWSTVKNGFTSGTVRNIDSRNPSGSNFQIMVAGGSLVSSAVTSGLWYIDWNSGTFGSAWTFPVNMPAIGDVSSQLEWGAWRYYGGFDQGSNLSLNPVASPLDSNGDPTGTGPKIDITYHDRYIFLLASNGVKKTIFWDPTTSAFKITSFGPGLMYEDGVPDSFVSTATAGGLAIGNHKSYYRYFDPDRVRWTALSAENDEDGNAAAHELLIDVQNTGGTQYNELYRAPDGFTTTEVFSTISSTATTIAAGGTFYRAGRGSINATTRRSTIHLGTLMYQDQGNGTFYSFITDESIPDPSRAYNIDVEETGELGDVYAVACYQGMTFALENQGGLLLLRWSNSFRTEWENFTPLNGYQTGIRSEDGWSCRFFVAGDYLYLQGGDQVYVIQRKGVSIGIVKVFSGLSIIHRQAMHVVGNQLFIVTQQGLLIVDPGSGKGSILRRLDRIFWDRWRGFLEPSSTTLSASIAYDAQMECLYIHNTALKEAVCLWLNTGKVSILLNTAADMVVSFPDIDSDQGERAYFFTNRRWFAVPQWTPTQAATMQGDFLQDTSNTIARLVKYNWAVAEYTNSNTSCPNYGGARVRIRLDPVAPAAHGADSPFTTDGTTAHTVCVAPMAIVVLSGACKGRTYQVVGNSDRYLWLADEMFPPYELAVGDVIAMAPVTMLAVGSMLWDDKGRIQVNARKKMHGSTVTVSRLSSTGDLAQLTPAAPSLSMVQFGLVRQDNYTASEPASSHATTNTDKGTPEYRGPNDVHILEPYGELDGPLNAALSTSKEAANWGRKVLDGTICFPFVTFRTSNYNVEVLFWDVLGEVTGSQLAGPGTL